MGLSASSEIVSLQFKQSQFLYSDCSDLVALPAECICCVILKHFDLERKGGRTIEKSSAWGVQKRRVQSAGTVLTYCPKVGLVMERT